jgi:hypothetical protein
MRALVLSTVIAITGCAETCEDVVRPGFAITILHPGGRPVCDAIVEASQGDRHWRLAQELYGCRYSWNGDGLHTVLVYRPGHRIGALTIDVPIDLCRSRVEKRIIEWSELD